MASSDLWQRFSSSLVSVPELQTGVAENSSREWRGTSRLWIVLDAVTVLGAAIVTTLYKFHTSPIAGMQGLRQVTLFFGRPMWIWLAFLCGFTFTLIVTSRRLHLYTPRHMTNILHEQRMSAQACFTSGLLLTGALYLVTRNLYSARHCGEHGRPGSRSRWVCGASSIACCFTGASIAAWIRATCSLSAPVPRHKRSGSISRASAIWATRSRASSIFSGSSFLRRTMPARDVVGNLDTLFENARKHFIDEIFFATPCERDVVQGVLEQARLHGIDLRVVPELYSGVPGTSTIEYIGQFPTIPLHRGKVPEMGLIFKRVFDTIFSLLALIVLAPVLAAVAIAIKLDSPGPVFYSSERIGKKGVVFRCIKFRTMVR